MRTTGPSPPALVPTISSGALPSTPASEWAAITNDVLKEHVTSTPVDSEVSGGLAEPQSNSPWPADGESASGNDGNDAKETSWTTTSSTYPTMNDASSSLSRFGSDSFPSASSCVSSDSTAQEAVESTAVNIGHGDSSGSSARMQWPVTRDPHFASSSARLSVYPTTNTSSMRRPPSASTSGSASESFADPSSGLSTHSTAQKTIESTAANIGHGDTSDGSTRMERPETQESYFASSSVPLATHPPPNNTDTSPSSQELASSSSSQSGAQTFASYSWCASDSAAQSTIGSTAANIGHGDTSDGTERPETQHSYPLSNHPSADNSASSKGLASSSSQSGPHSFASPSDTALSDSATHETINSTGVNLGHGHAYGPAPEHHRTEKLVSQPPHGRWADKSVHTSESGFQPFLSPPLSSDLSFVSTAHETIDSTAVEIGHGHGTYHGLASKHHLTKSPVSSEPPPTRGADETVHLLSRSQSFASPSSGPSLDSTAHESIDSMAVEIGHDNSRGAYGYASDDPPHAHRADGVSRTPSLTPANAPPERRPPLVESPAQSHASSMAVHTGHSLRSSSFPMSASASLASSAPASPDADADLLSELHLDFITRPAMRSDSTGLSTRAHTGHRGSVSAVAARPSYGSPSPSATSHLPPTSPVPTSVYPLVDGALVGVDGHRVQSPQPLVPEDMDMNLFLPEEGKTGGHWNRCPVRCAAVECKHRVREGARRPRFIPDGGLDVDLDTGVDMGMGMGMGMGMNIAGDGEAEPAKGKEKDGHWNRCPVRGAAVECKHRVREGARRPHLIPERGLDAAMHVAMNTGMAVAVARGKEQEQEDGVREMENEG
ncbi:hypothetical protein C8R47DRAFT_1313000 [Mycena vitilis]|nr:hypothetical protein C8R47DRAFT_1313000 [Mycena vitilis]